MTTPSETPYHVPVLADEVLVALGLEKARSGGVWLDGTVGGGGHAARILAATAPKGRLVGVDRDDAALAATALRLGTRTSERSERGDGARREAEGRPSANRTTLLRASFDEVEDILERANIAKGSLSGALLDIGVSSRQIDDPDRGFSFQTEGPLDMRMDRRQDATAADLVNQLSHGELAKILREYGDENNAGRIATKILERREKAPLVGTKDLVQAVVAAFGGREKKGSVHVATRTFQALRIAVNAELSSLERALPKLFDALAVGGRLAVISFHSLEDRIVKHTFRDWATGCICPKNIPVCICHRKPKARLVTKKGVRATDEESQQNPRARSATLRAVEKLGADLA